MPDVHPVDGIRVRAADCAEEVEAARRLIRDRGLPELFARIDPGAYGFTREGLDALAAVERSLALVAEVAKRLRQTLTAGAGDGFARPRALEPEERLFVGLFATYAAAVEGGEAMAALGGDRVRVENRFHLLQVKDLVAGPLDALPRRLLDDLAAYVDHHRRVRSDLRVDSATALVRCLTAYFLLLAATVVELARDAALSHLNRALAAIPVELLGRSYRGFRWRRLAADVDASGLLAVDVGDVVGNREYLAACQRTARDVAGFDFASGKNPKTVNPILFALGPPGCGKTVTAHAVGNYFLDYCRERGVPARFLCIRRTDWASSYQNASANNLVRIFTSEVAGFDGVVGLYWPDVDTAFAARGDRRVRIEEKGILAASFGIFDGTLLPKDGRWFMMTDANVMNMDPATVSRITQDPFLLAGAETVADVVRLLRDVKLRRHRSHLEIDEEGWSRIGELCLETGLSGRAIDNVARRAIVEIEDFEVPDEYFSAPLERRREIIALRSRPFTASGLRRIVERYAEFEREAEERAGRQRFERRVEEIVLNLGAERAAVARFSP